LVRDAGTATVDFTDAGPFLSGSATFVRAGPPSVSPYRHCDAVFLPYAWTGGTATVTFDPDAVDFTGSALGARFTRFHTA
jgi:hypothetical protein